MAADLDLADAALTIHNNAHRLVAPSSSLILGGDPSGASSFEHVQSALHTIKTYLSVSIKASQPSPEISASIPAVTQALCALVAAITMTPPSTSNDDAAAAAIKKLVLETSDIIKGPLVRASLAAEHTAVGTAAELLKLWETRVKSAKAPSFVVLNAIWRALLVLLTQDQGATPWKALDGNVHARALSDDAILRGDNDAAATETNGGAFVAQKCLADSLYRLQTVLLAQGRPLDNAQAKLAAFWAQAVGKIAAAWPALAWSQAGAMTDVGALLCAAVAAPNSDSVVVDTLQTKALLPLHRAFAGAIAATIRHSRPEIQKAMLFRALLGNSRAAPVAARLASAASVLTIAVNTVDHPLAPEHAVSALAVMSRWAGEDVHATTQSKAESLSLYSQVVSTAVLLALHAWDAPGGVGCRALERWLMFDCASQGAFAAPIAADIWHALANRRLSAKTIAPYLLVITQALARAIGAGVNLAVDAVSDPRICHLVLAAGVLVTQCKCEATCAWFADDVLRQTVEQAATCGDVKAWDAACAAATLLDHLAAMRVTPAQRAAGAAASMAGGVLRRGAAMRPHSVVGAFRVTAMLACHLDSAGPAPVTDWGVGDRAMCFSACERVIMQAVQDDDHSMGASAPDAPSAALECYARLWMSAKCLADEPKRGAPVFAVADAIEQLVERTASPPARVNAALRALIASAFGAHLLTSDNAATLAPEAKSSVRRAWQLLMNPMISENMPGGQSLLMHAAVSRLVYFSRQPYAAHVDERDVRELRPEGLREDPNCAQAFAKITRALLSAST
ncbi:hypothetical protein RI054_07g39250 [Pseudoscourfieldia marina]